MYRELKKTRVFGKIIWTKRAVQPYLPKNSLNSNALKMWFVTTQAKLLVVSLSHQITAAIRRSANNTYCLNTYLMH